MAMETVYWYVAQKHTYPGMGRLEGDDDVLTVLSQRPDGMLSRMLANTAVSETATLSIEMVAKINSFLPVKKGVVVRTDEFLPRVISLTNLADVCEKIAALPSNNDPNCCSAKYEVITIAKAYLQTIGRAVRLTYFQFAFTRAELVADGTVVCPIHPPVEWSSGFVVTFYGIIGYLLNDRDWMNTYLKSPTASFASDDNPDVHTHLSGDKEEKWIIGNKSELPRRSRYMSPYPSPYGDDSNSDDDFRDY